MGPDTRDLRVGAIPPAAPGPRQPLRQRRACVPPLIAKTEMNKRGAGGGFDAVELTPRLPQLSVINKLLPANQAACWLLPTC